jgi:hypothetical protein
VWHIAITVFRIASLIFIGYVLYIILLFLIGCQESFRLKRRKRPTTFGQENIKSKILHQYILILVFLIILSFLLINICIRGVS